MVTDWDWIGGILLRIIILPEMLPPFMFGTERSRLLNGHR
jgi:hypothetical protein